MEEPNNPEDRLFRHLTRSEYSRVRSEMDDYLLSLIFGELDDNEFRKIREECLDRHGWTDDEFRDFEHR